MKAIIWTDYGPPDVLVLREVEKPKPNGDEVLVKVFATSVSAGDCELRRFHITPSVWLWLRLYIGLTKPRRITILGQEMAGVVEAVGKDVAGFREGDRILGISGFKMSTYAEYVCISQNEPLVKKPDHLTFEEAAAMSVGGFEALHFHQRANVQKGQDILINGAGGSIGTMALQLAKMSGAKVTCVDSSIKLDMLRDLGADVVIDYAREDFSKNEGAYDVIFDVVGKIPFSRAMRSLKKDGTLILGNPGFILPKLYRLWAAVSSHRKLISNQASGTKEELEHLKAIIASGKVKVVIDRTYPLEMTADAHRYIEEGLKKGNVAITVAHEESSGQR